MNAIADELESIINKYLDALKLLTEEQMSVKPSPAKWSKKEVIGHLIDSAQANIRRFVVAQYEDTPAISYNQDQWVAIAHYQQWNIHDLVGLWYLLNKQACKILRNTSHETAQRTCQTESLRTIEWLAVDYIKHLRHHLHQVLELEPVPYP